jgi:hypothetical protein
VPTKQPKRNGKIQDVWNCPDIFAYRCPLEWSSFDKTADDRIRQCRTCEKPVHLCLTPEDFVSHGMAGECVAVPRELNAESLDVHIRGMISISALKKRFGDDNEARRYWTRVIELSPQFARPAMERIAERLDRLARLTRE